MQKEGQREDLRRALEGRQQGGADTKVIRRVLEGAVEVGQSQCKRLREDVEEELREAVREGKIREVDATSWIPEGVQIRRGLMKDDVMEP